MITKSAKKTIFIKHLLELYFLHSVKTFIYAEHDSEGIPHLLAAACKKCYFIFGNLPRKFGIVRRHGRMTTLQYFLTERLIPMNQFLF